ncbi:MAG: hypothetical protein RLZZ524_3250, partial [Pseudomonadota bacterium]
RLKTLSFDDLLNLRGRYLAMYKQELALEAANNGKTSGGRILMRL